MKLKISKMTVLPLFLTVQLCIAVFHESLLHEGWMNFVTIVWIMLTVILGCLLGYRLLKFPTHQD